MKQKTRMPLVDVCFISAGRVDLFSKCVDAALKETENVDCAYYVQLTNIPREKRGEYEQVVSRIPHVNLRWSAENIGYPKSANRVIHQGYAPLVLFLTDDVVLKEGAVDKLVRRMDDPSIALCGLKLLFPLESTDPARPAGKVQHIGHACTIRGDIIHVHVGWDADHPKCCKSREVLSVTGAAFMVRRKPFLEAGGFFEGYGRGTFEDTDLSLTLRSMGYKIFLEAEAQAYHWVGATADMRKEPFPLVQNKQIFMSRHQQHLVWDEWLY